MSAFPSTINFHPSSLFTKPAALPANCRPAHQTVQYSDLARERSHSSASISSIDTEFTHFRPIRRAAVSPRTPADKQLVIARPAPVRTSTVTTCTLSTLRIGVAVETDQDREEARIKQEKMDCELAWRIHKQEKRFMFRQTSTRNSVRLSPVRDRCNQVQGRREVKYPVLDEMCRSKAKISISGGKKRQEQLRRQQKSLRPGSSKC
eukprot:GFUD01029371.1.p1 GENE.GFUD01029371.1~~GFUD01029371.1.p1  ORF type:complete len:206 (-),score=74.28 GFUD01029371.1:21-638(-)